MTISTPSSAPSLSVDQPLQGTLRVVAHDAATGTWTAACTVCGRRVTATAARLKRRKGCADRGCNGQRRRLEDGPPFGRWKVVRYLGPNESGKSMYECVCACGKTPPRAVQASNLTAGLSKSCGCWQAERMAYVRRGEAPPPIEA